MKKYIFGLILIITLLVASPLAVSASTVTDIKARITALEKELLNLRYQLQAAVGYSVPVEPSSYTLTLNFAGTGSGSMSSPQGMGCTQGCSKVFNSGTAVTLNTTPNDGSYFAGFGGDCSGSGSSTTVTMNGNKSCSITFHKSPVTTPSSYTLTMNLIGSGSGSIFSPAGMSCTQSCSKSFPSGTSVTFTATPNTGSSLDDFSGDCVGFSAIMNSNKTCTVNFGIQPNTEIKSYLSSSRVDISGNTAVYKIKVSAKAVYDDAFLDTSCEKANGHIPGEGVEFTVSGPNTSVNCVLTNLSTNQLTSMNNWSAQEADDQLLELNVAVAGFTDNTQVTMTSINWGESDTTTLNKYHTVNYAAPKTPTTIVTPLPVPEPKPVKPVVPINSGCSNGEVYSSASGQPCRRIALWSGKVNQHFNLITGQWESDSDGVSGADVDKIAYCNKWYPNTVNVQKNAEEVISNWHDRGNTGSYTSTKLSYQCVQGALTGGPTISYITPTSVEPGGKVVVHGTNYNENTFVAFDGPYGKTIWPDGGIKGVIGDENFIFTVPSDTSMGNHTVQVGEKGASYNLSKLFSLSVTIPRPINPNTFTPSTITPVKPINDNIIPSLTPIVPTTGIVSSCPTINFALGASGPSVIEVQNKLIAGGWLKLPPGISTGYAGNLTFDAQARCRKGVNPTSNIVPTSSVVPTTSIVPTAFSNVNFKIGATGLDVMQVQKELIAKHCLVLPEGIARGYWGNLSAEALRKCQQMINPTSPSTEKSYCVGTTYVPYEGALGGVVKGKCGVPLN